MGKVDLTLKVLYHSMVTIEHGVNRLNTVVFPDSKVVNLHPA